MCVCVCEYIRMIHTYAQLSKRVENKLHDSYQLKKKTGTACQECGAPYSWQAVPVIIIIIIILLSCYYYYHYYFIISSCRVTCAPHSWQAVPFLFYFFILLLVAVV